MIEGSFYDLLGIPRLAGDNDIHKAYRQKAKVYHPDRFPLNSPERESAERWFKQLSVAHDTLSDAGLRAAYDADLAEQERKRWAPQVYDFPVRMPPPARPTKEFEDFLDDRRRELDDEDEEGSADTPSVEEVIKRGTSEATRKSAAKAYYAQGLRYASYGDYDRASSLIHLARQMDPGLKVSPWLIAKLGRYR